jgi:hypothetical protein
VEFHGYCAVCCRAGKHRSRSVHQRHE